VSAVWNPLIRLPKTSIGIPHFPLFPADVLQIPQ
jgi:hypothetical protein